MAETFQQAEFLNPEPQLTWDGTVWGMQMGATWGSTIELPPLRLDDLAYVLDGLGYC